MVNSQCRVFLLFPIPRNHCLPDTVICAVHMEVTVDLQFVILMLALTILVCLDILVIWATNPIGYGYSILCSHVKHWLLTTSLAFEIFLVIAKWCYWGNAPAGSDLWQEAVLIESDMWRLFLPSTVCALTLSGDVCHWKWNSETCEHDLRKTFISLSVWACSFSRLPSDSWFCSLASTSNIRG